MERRLDEHDRALFGSWDEKHELRTPGLVEAFRGFVLDVHRSWYIAGVVGVVILLHDLGVPTNLIWTAITKFFGG